MQIIINLPPITKKNNMQIIYNKALHRPMLIQSAKYRQYEKDCAFLIPPKYRLKINYPVNVKCLFYRDSNRRCDLTNLLEAIDDILVKYEVLKDDNFNILVSHDGSRVFVDKARPRTEIEITKLEDYEKWN